mmetsp:Transcript_27035/g.40622  ORF Transcript_27035/g.40622 Transcript_27035/m.40622 type:complete len:429 (+) Transcript_27035:70-1356(+)
MPWISKKAKAQMRSRRRKKEKSKSNAKSSTQGQNSSSSNSGGPHADEEHALKRKREEESSGSTSSDNDKYSHFDAGETGAETGAIELSTEDNWKNIKKDTVISITVPSTLTSKEAKKLRKETRRKARKEGKDEKFIKFVDEDGTPLLSLVEQEGEHENDGGSGGGDSGVTSDDETNGDGRADSKQSQMKMEAGRKKRKVAKKSFPRINQLLAEAEAAKKEQEEKDKRKSYEDSIPSEVKAQYVALDCEMVGIGAEGKQSALARVSLTDWYGEVILDTFVQVPDRVTDFRTFVSGVRAKDIRITSSNSMELHACRKKVGEIIKNKILVGHSLKNDFAALMLGHPKHLIRDTARYKPFMRASGRNGGKLRPRKLRDLVKEQVGLTIQKEGEAHTSVEDAKATMELYKVVRGQWEKEIEKLESSRTTKRKR